MSSVTSVAAVVPTHDRAAFIGRALRSIASQTRTPDEVIVVDDGSTDDTAAIVRRDFPSVRLIGQENRGVSAARNRGIAAAGSEWIAFLDSDDEWLPAKLERQLRALERSPALRVSHTNEVWMRDGRRVQPRKKHAKHGGRIFRECLPICSIGASTVVIHRSVFEELGAFDEALPVCEDYDLWLRISAVKPVLYLDEPLTVKHGGHRDQLSTGYPGMDRFRIRALEKVIASGRLGEDDRRAAVAALLEKIEIYAGGARKRGRESEAAAYEAKRARHLESRDRP